MPDSPQARADWFLSRRKTKDSLQSQLLGGGAPQTPADNLRNAYRQLQLLRTKGGAGAAATPAWTEIGPRPQVDSLWGDVGGRVTSLAYYEKQGHATLFVGTALGGVWDVKDPLTPKPSVTPVIDAWLSLSVGAIGGRQ